MADWEEQRVKQALAEAEAEKFKAQAEYHKAPKTRVICTLVLKMWVVTCGTVLLGIVLGKVL